MLRSPSRIKFGFEKIHVFPYSSRPGTKAAALPQLSKAVKEERARRMREAADDMRRRFLTGEMGKRFPVLFETTAPDGFLEGYTPNYTPCAYAPQRSFVAQSGRLRSPGLPRMAAQGFLTK